MRGLEVVRQTRPDVHLFRNPNTETRIPKESRNPNGASAAFRIRIRISFGFRSSDFGPWISDFRRLDFPSGNDEIPSMPRVVLENVTKIFQTTDGATVKALDNANLVVEEKELLVLVGPSGCGKTTTLRIIAGLEMPSSGNVSIEGLNMDGVAAKDRDVAMVFQNYALYPHMTARENLGFGLKLRRVPKPEIAKRVVELSEMLDLNNCLDRRPEALSGGQRQRVALGRALARRPKVLLMDEPLSALDRRLREQMRAEVVRLQRQLGLTILYVTHDQFEAVALGQRIAVMHDGAIQQVANGTTLYQSPSNPFVAAFFRAPVAQNVASVTGNGTR
jgi:multiple sugar transport system ATP-binding protein